MRIGIGLPNPVLDVPGRLLVDWARRAQDRRFSSLATIDRLAYPSYDSLTALTAAAAATDRIGLLTNILLEPAYNPALLAKVTASIDQISEGRLTLGLGVGGRPDDYPFAGRPFAGRGARFDADLELLHQAWAGQPVAGSPFPVGPPTARGRIPLVIGGQPELAAPRAVRWEAGFTIGGAPPEMAAGAIQQFKTAWKEAGGNGQPRILALSFSLGESTPRSRCTTCGPTTGSWATGPSPLTEGHPAPATTMIVQGRDHRVHRGAGASRRLATHGPAMCWRCHGEGRVAVAIVFETHSLTTDNEAALTTGWLDGRLSERGRVLAAELGRRRRNDSAGRSLTARATSRSWTGSPSSWRSWPATGTGPGC